MQNGKQVKRGELLLKENDSTDSIYVIKQGRISLFIERSGKKIEIEQLGSTQILGEQAVIGNARQPYSAEAVNATEVMALPVRVLQQQYEAAAPGVKLLIKSLADGLKNTRQQLRNLRMEQDNSPCPQFSIPRLFGILSMVAFRSGKRQEGSEDIVVSWASLKISTSRIFLESHQKMMSVLELLQKIKHVSLRFEKNEDEEEELADITIHNLSIIEQFGEFYQYNLYKPGRSEVIYVDPIALQVTTSLLGCAKDQEVDRRGLVTLEYNTMLAHIKEEFGYDLKGTHLDLLEKKGLFVKRSTRDDGVFISFEKVEFENMLAFWQIIREIDKWNEKGFVDPNYIDDFKAQGHIVAKCPGCDSEINKEHRFCPACGQKLTAAA